MAPVWATTLGWVLTLSSVSLLPIWAIYALVTTPGTLPQVTLVFLELFLRKIKKQVTIQGAFLFFFLLDSGSSTSAAQPGGPPQPSIKSPPTARCRPTALRCHWPTNVWSKLQDSCRRRPHDHNQRHATPAQTIRKFKTHQISLKYKPTDDLLLWIKSADKVFVLFISRSHSVENETIRTSKRMFPLISKSKPTCPHTASRKCVDELLVGLVPQRTAGRELNHGSFL